MRRNGQTDLYDLVQIGLNIRKILDLISTSVLALPTTIEKSLTYLIGDGSLKMEKDSL